MSRDGGRRVRTDHAATGPGTSRVVHWGRRHWPTAFHPSTWLRLPQPTSLVLIAIAVGLATGVGSVAFIRLLQLATSVFFDGGRWLFSGLGRYHVLLLPAIGGLIVGPLIVHFAREAKGHGVLS
ncbi:MAG: hypothetical protein HYY11_08445 [Candidatus Methylomirabilis oxyfera]|nr:hypothetical protein [Candidatus Methylomirabilis oxyfera]